MKIPERSSLNLVNGQPKSSVADVTTAATTPAGQVDDICLGSPDSAGLIPAPKCPCTPPPVHNYQVVHRVAGQHWQWIELLRDENSHMQQRDFHPSQVIRDPEISSAFGSSTPSSSDVLLHYAGDPPPDVAVQPRPVILVHGATKNGNFWVNPEEYGGEDQATLPDTLRQQGFRVFAVSFAHSQDDNFVWAQDLANSVDRVKELSGSSEVDILAHSKGGVPARMYVSDFREDWMSGYGHDVHRLILAAAPNGGIDFSFRHGDNNWPLHNPALESNINAPSPWSHVKYFGVPVNVEDRGFGKEGKDYWPGQRQLLARWDSKYPISYFGTDNYTTYYGGQGFVSSAKGIEAYIRESGDFMAHLNEAKIDPKVEVALLAGKKPNLNNFPNEIDGPSDGLLFVESALHMPSTDHIIDQKVLPLNHKAVVTDPRGQKWIAETLKRE